MIRSAKQIFFVVTALLYLGSTLVPCAVADIDVAGSVATKHSEAAPAWKAECPCHKSGAPTLQNVGNDWQGPPSKQTLPVVAEAPGYPALRCATPSSRDAAPPDPIPIA